MKQLRSAPSIGPRIARPQFLLSSACLGLAVALTGCGGSSSPIPLTSVSGNVTFEGAPVEKGNITFMPASGAGESASATIAAGKYELGTFAVGDGAPAGEYKVAIQAYTVEPTMDDPKGKPAIPERYLTANNSQLTAKVQESGSQTIDFPLTK